jgi:molybdenum cofactor cytidylyltransferase
VKAAIVLAAGRSTRMGRPKLALSVGGAPMVERVVSTLLGAGFDLVRVVSAPGASHRFPGGVEVVQNPGAEGGIATSIRRGLEGLPEETEVAAIALGDMPLVSGETVKKLLSAYEETGSAIVFPEHRGRQGNPVLWGRAFFPALRELEGDRGAKALLAKNRERALAVVVDDPGVCVDVDTPEDYSRISSDS